MSYEKPAVEDYGDLVALTAAGSLGGTEDGAGKTIQAGVGGVAAVTIGVLP